VIGPRCREDLCLDTAARRPTIHNSHLTSPLTEAAVLVERRWARRSRRYRVWMIPASAGSSSYEMADVLKDFDPDDLTFDVNLGFDDGFIGLDGADKSTTMRLILAS
jgi:ABC-type polysaccharide/polyol phosphate transport system ATPase subunit